MAAEAVEVEENANVPVEESRCVFFRYVCGDMRPMKVWLEGKPAPVRFLDWYVRGATQPLFLSNPLGGVLVISGLLVESPWMGLCGLVGLFFSTLTAVIFRQDKGCVESGGGGFNGLLTGLLLAALSRDPDWHGLTIVPVIVMAIISTFVNSGLSGILGKMELPSLNLAFNVAVLVYATAAGPRDSYPRLYRADRQQLLPNQTANLTAADQIDWIRVLQAVPVGVGQCYGCGQAVAGGLISAGILVASPMVFYHCVMGAVIGIGTALILGVPLHWVYSGACAYNSVLGTTAVGGVFYVLTIQSHLLSLVCGILCALLWAGMTDVFAMLDLPVLAFPFCLGTLLFLGATSESRALQKVPLSHVTYPEEHRRRFKRNAIVPANPN